MKVDLGIMCRGIGTCRIELLVSEIPVQNRIVLSAYLANGNRIPLERLQENLQSGEKRQIICSVPYLKNERFELICKEEDAQEQYVAERRLPLSFTKIKWISRKNYLLNRELALRIRDSKRFFDCGFAYIEPRFYLKNRASNPANGSEYVLMAYVRIFHLEEDIHVYLLDELGRCIRDQKIPAESFYAIYPDGSQSEKLYESSFTMLIPDDPKTYCVVVESKMSNAIGYLCIDDERRELFSKNKDYRYYKVNDTFYNLFVRETGLLGSQNVDLTADSVLDVGLFSIVVPIYNTPIPFLNEMIGSVLAQTYKNWELVLVNASPENLELNEALALYTDPRIHVIEVSDNKGIAGNTNVGIEAARGEFIFLLDHDDFIDPGTLFLYAQAIEKDPTLDLLYCDEDKYNETDGFTQPHLKPDFSIDLLRSHNYITHFLCMRSSLMKELKIKSTYDGAQDYDLILRAVEKTGSIYHIPYVLYHWRMHAQSTAQSIDAKPEANENGRRALQAHLDRCGCVAKAELTDFACVYQAVYEVEENPLVSILIPYKDNVDILKQCIESIEEKTAYQNYEIIIIDGSHNQEETRELYEHLHQAYKRARVIRWEYESNCLQAINYGASFAKGEYLLILDNGMKIINPEWLGNLVSNCHQSEAGIVGAKLLLIFADAQYI